jgi:hypothetical protein
VGQRPFVDPLETAPQKEEFACVDLAQADRFAIAFAQDVVRIRRRSVKDFLPIRDNAMVAEAQTFHFRQNRGD